MKTHLKNDTQTIKDHSTSIDIKNDSKLSVEYWNLKAGNSNPNVRWAVKNQISAYNPESKRCSHCLNQELEIFEDKKSNLLSKKSEIISKCHYQNKYILRTLTSKIENLDVK